MPLARDTKKRKNIIWSATPTPFKTDGSLDLRSLERVVEQHRRLGVSGLFVGGTCGEGGFMLDGQRTEVVRRIKQFAGDSLHIAAHVTETSAARVTENIARMTDAGADSAVIAPPFLVADFCNRDFLRRYFLEPLNASQIPVGIYVRLPLSKMALNLDFWEEIIQHPRVKFVKDSSGSTDYRHHFLGLKSRRPDITLLTGAEFDVVPAVAEGYDGCLMGTGILNAGLIGKALDALASGNPTDAESWQQRSNKLLFDLFRRDISSWLAGLKYALCKLGIFASGIFTPEFPINRRRPTPDRRGLGTRKELPMTLRYRETGEVHIDFHRSTNGTITYLRDTYGREFLDVTFRRMAENVYRAIHDDLKAGDSEQLVEHWTHFFEREGGQYTLERKDDAIRFVVHRCPAIAHLQSRGIAIDRDFCRQTIVINETLAEGTPFEITTEVLGGGKCVQTIRRRAGQ